MADFFNIQTKNKRNAQLRECERIEHASQK